MTLRTKIAIPLAGIHLVLVVVCFGAAIVLALQAAAGIAALASVYLLRW
jgi:hypothetical protein